MKTPADLELKIPPHAFFARGIPLICTEAIRRPAVWVLTPAYFLALLRACQRPGARYPSYEQLMKTESHGPGGYDGYRGLLECSHPHGPLVYRVASGLASLFIWNLTPEDIGFWSHMDITPSSEMKRSDFLESRLSRFVPRKKDGILEELDAFMFLLKKLELI